MKEREGKNGEKVSGKEKKKRREKDATYVIDAKVDNACNFL